MPNFQVEIQKIEYGYVNVKARDAEEAKKIVRRDKIKPKRKHTYTSILDEVVNVEQTG